MERVDEYVWVIGSNISDSLMGRDIGEAMDGVYAYRLEKEEPYSVPPENNEKTTLNLIPLGPEYWSFSM